MVDAALLGLANYWDHPAPPLRIGQEHELMGMTAPVDLGDYGEQAPSVHP